MDRQIDRWNIYKCIELNYCKTFTERFKRQWEVGKFCGRFSWGAQGEFPPGCMKLAAFFLPGFLERMTLFPLHSLLRSAQCPWPSPLPPSTHPSLFWISWFKLIIASTEHPKPKWSFGARAGIKPGEWQGNQSRTQDRHTFPGKPSRTGIHPCLVAPAPTCTKALLPLFLVILSCLLSMTAKCQGLAGCMKHLLAVGSRKGAGHSVGWWWAVRNNLFTHSSHGGQSNLIQPYKVTAIQTTNCACAY